MFLFGYEDPNLLATLLACYLRKNIWFLLHFSAFVCACLFRELYLDQDKPDEAKNVLQRLRGTDNVVAELKDLETQASEATLHKPISIKKVRLPSI